MCVLLLAPATGLMLGAPGASSSGEPASAATYLPLLLTSAGFALYVTRLGLGRSIFWQLLSENRRDSRRVFLDACLGVLAAATLLACDLALQRLGGFPDSVAGHALLPRSPAAKLLWPALAASVVGSEELIYRGYLQRTFMATTGSAPLALALQALLFGIAHGEQGAFVAARAAVYGFLLGVLAWQRRSLVSALACHLALDLYAGFSG